MKLTIVIPIYVSEPLHLDFTRQTLATIKTRHDYEVFLIVNFCKPEFKKDLSSLSIYPEQRRRIYTERSRSTAHPASPAVRPDPNSKSKSLSTAHCSLIPNSKGNILAAAWNLGISKSFNLSPDTISHIPNPITHIPDPRSQIPDPNIKSKSLPTVHRPLISDYCLLLNNDILLHPECIDNLVTFAQNHPEFLLWSGTVWPDSRTLAKAKWDGSFSLHPHFSCFMVSPQTIAEAGFFDEHFTMGYFEDNDYHTRLLLTGHQTAATTAAKFYHYGSRTINVDDNLKIEAKFHYQENRAYFKKKWGLDIHGRAFSPPDTILKEIYPHPFNDKKKT